MVIAHLEMKEIVENIRKQIVAILVFLSSFDILLARMMWTYTKRHNKLGPICRRIKCAYLAVCSIFFPTVTEKYIRSHLYSQNNLYKFNLKFGLTAEWHPGTFTLISQGSHSALCEKCDVSQQLQSWWRFNGCDVLWSLAFPFDAEPLISRTYVR